MAATAITGQLNGSVPFASAVSPDAGSTAGNNPKAYLTVLFFDERFNFVTDGSINQRVIQAGNGALPLALTNVKAPKNGYAYVYVSNESDEMVYFDNLQVTHARKHIIEENHYYAYGLRIAGISSRKLSIAEEGNIKNGYLYNDKELFEDANLNWYDYGFRMYDPQIGRFPQLDPLTFDYPYYAPYQYAGCEPVANVDLDGLEPLRSLRGQVTTIMISKMPETAAKTGVNASKIGFNLGFNAAKIASTLFNNAMMDKQVRDGIISHVYQIINPRMRSREGNWSFRTHAEEEVIKAEISKHTYVDLDLDRAYVMNPKTEEPSMVFVFFTKAVGTTVDELKPLALKTAGVGMYEVGQLLKRVSLNVESYRSDFFRKFFPKKFAMANSISAKSLGIFGKTVRKLGSGLKVFGKLLDIAGTVTMYYDVLNAGSPTYWDDDAIKENTRNQISRFLSESEN